MKFKYYLKINLKKIVHHQNKIKIFKKKIVIKIIRI